MDALSRRIFLGRRPRRCSFLIVRNEPFALTVFSEQEWVEDDVQKGNSFLEQVAEFLEVRSVSEFYAARLAASLQVRDMVVPFSQQIS